MEDDNRVTAEIVTKFFLNTCQIRNWLNEESRQSLAICTMLANANAGRKHNVPLTTGSVAEMYIEPMLTCVGDIDIMYHKNDLLAIPKGAHPPTLLPSEFHNRVEVGMIVDSEFPGYVYLVRTHVLTECTDGKYNSVWCKPLHYDLYASHLSKPDEAEVHGPSIVVEGLGELSFPVTKRLSDSCFTVDLVRCVRCLSWPSQAADWPTRHRNYWPDSATVGRVVSNGCDVVGVSHRLCREDKWMHHTHWRLSFSRAEVVLLNSWMPIQQIVYHMLRTFVKTERLTDSANNTGTSTIFSNYHIKTLLLWASEMNPVSWWTDDLNVIRIIVELLHTWAVWLTGEECPHYFVSNCNLLNHLEYAFQITESLNKVLSVSEKWLADWFVDNHIRKCAAIATCPDNVSQLFNDMSSSTKLHNAVSALIDWRVETSQLFSLGSFTLAQVHILLDLPEASLQKPMTMWFCICWFRQLSQFDHRLCVYFTAAIFLHVALKSTSTRMTDEMLDVLATTCLQSNDLRGFLNARHSSVLSLSQATALMKVIVANSSHSTVQLIEIELSKAYLYRALRCKDSDSDSIYCLANVYLAVLYYTTGQYQTAIDHCRSLTKSQCSSRVVQGEILPKINDDIDSLLGLAVLYQYITANALNYRQTQVVSVFTAKLFAYYLRSECLSVRKCQQLRQISSTADILLYHKCFCESTTLFITDVLVFRSVYGRHTTYTPNCRKQMEVVNEGIGPITHQLDTAKLVELLQESAVEHMTTFRKLEARDFNSVATIATADFEAVYAYKCGQIQRCLELSTSISLSTLRGGVNIAVICMSPELIQLMDDDIASLIGLTAIADPRGRRSYHNILLRQLSLSLYLMAQAQIKLRHSLTSLAMTLNYIEVASRKHTKHYTLDQLLLKLAERKLMQHISRNF